MLDLPVDGGNDDLTFWCNPFDDGALHPFRVVSAGLVSALLNLRCDNVRTRKRCKM